MVTLTGEYSWPASSPDLAVIENCWGIIKYDIDYSRCTDADSLFAEAERAWNAIPMSTINEMIADFAPRLVTVQAVGGECLNQHKSILRKFREGMPQGYAECNRVNGNRMAVARFCQESAAMFADPGRFPMDWRTGQEGADPEAIRNSYCMSAHICEQLPEELRSRLGLPQPYTVTTVKCIPMVYAEEAGENWLLQ